jgi:hypothetical protein
VRNFASQQIERRAVVAECAVESDAGTFNAEVLELKIPEMQSLPTRDLGSNLVNRVPAKDRRVTAKVPEALFSDDF